MENYIEELVAEYYKTKGYFVLTNYWIPFQTNRNRTQKGKDQNYSAQSWTDIDVLARNDKELLLIQVKSIINRKEVAEKINIYFDRITEFLNNGKALDGKADIMWWTKDVILKKIVIYEYKNTPPSYKKIIEDKGAETIYFGEVLNDIVKYIEDKKGVKEENAIMRLLHFLKQNNQINIKYETIPNKNRF
ncbi:MAG: hypothetical protein JXQ69_07945 [Paludibacteraceae bacterium]|nr:hypothetical protein [Paludibacteraceae bacterium]MBN2788236.1 hypothetical protein [Paludibacteraceae bacterium]